MLLRKGRGEEVVVANDDDDHDEDGDNNRRDDDDNGDEGYVTMAPNMDLGDDDDNENNVDKNENGDNDIKRRGRSGSVGLSSGWIGMPTPSRRTVASFSSLRPTQRRPPPPTPPTTRTRTRTPTRTPSIAGHPNSPPMYDLIRRKSRETLQATRSSFVRTLGHEEDLVACRVSLDFLRMRSYIGGEFGCPAIEGVLVGVLVLVLVVGGVGGGGLLWVGLKEEEEATVRRDGVGIPIHPLDNPTDPLLPLLLISLSPFSFSSTSFSLSSSSSESMFGAMGT